RRSTGLDRAVSGKGRTLLSGHRPVERNGGGRQVGFKARTVRQHGCGSSRRHLALSAVNRTDGPARDATQRGCDTYVGSSEPARPPNLPILATTPAGTRPPVADILCAREEVGQARGPYGVRASVRSVSRASARTWAAISSMSASPKIASS